MNERRAGESGQTTADAATSSAPRWKAICVLPNVTLDAPIEASRAALVPCHDDRFREIAGQRPELQSFVGAFCNEFGNQIWPTIGLVREDAPRSISNTTVFGAFRDAVCVSVIIAGQSLALKWNSPDRGILYSDAFDIYPWFPSPEPGFEKYITVMTPALRGLEEVGRLRPQSAPCLGNRSLSPIHIDCPLLQALVERWERCFATGRENVEDRRLFRALEMACAASRIPGGADASEHDAGRAVALWVSAFEILTYKGKGHRAKKVVLSRLAQVEWQTAKLKVRDRRVKLGEKETIQTNVAGEVYDHLNRVRNDFLHGNPVTPETLKLAKRQQSVLFFAAPLFRLALTVFLDLRSQELSDASDDQDCDHIAGGIPFSGPQRLAEDAILKADDAPDAG
jgi:hypothetical protein